MRRDAEGGDPPVVAAASTNNQAVTNIIDAFGKDFAEGDGPFASRWLPDIESFGLYLPSRSREREASKRYQTESLFADIENEEYLKRAKTSFLAAGNAAFPELKARGVKVVVDALREQIDLKVRKLEAVDRALANRDGAQAEVDRLLGDKPADTLRALRAVRDDLEQERMTNKGQLTRWEEYLAEESIFLSLFAFLPPVARKRTPKARRFLSEIGCSGLADTTRLDVNGVDSELRKRLSRAVKSLNEAHEGLSQCDAALEGLRRAKQKFASAARSIANGKDEVDLPALERLADCGVRFDLFRLATHYWEGRWICAIEELLPEIDKERTKRGRKAVIPRWRRRMMLTPCMVSTFATLPGKMTARKHVNGGWEDEYLFNFVDLLIVDEAGQVQPEAAGGAFALARRALVIGDTQQIEPIASLPKSVDIGNLIKFEVLSRPCLEKDRERANSLGVCSTGGSAMRVAQSACKYFPEPQLSRGLWLFEHRRCFDEIVECCNALCYKGKLEPKRGPAAGKDGEAPTLPPLGYFHVDGFCQSAGGSRRNTAEAKTIAAWLAAQREELQCRYGKRLEEIVGVVTPFGAQVRAVQDVCRNAGIEVDGRDGMTVGTVHALQGADRNVVVFSPAYSKHSDGGFIDSSTSMLNVAVSRAKDAFLVFGDMDLFSSAAPGSPRQKLGEFLFAEPENALEFDALCRDDLAVGEREPKMLRDAEEHVAFLHAVLANRSLNKIRIVSPWIVVGTMERTGILSAMKEARSRGAEVEVYVDPELNADEIGNGTTNLQRARTTLEPLGIDLIEVPRIHSKIVLADEELLCIGSFNWLSAQRYGAYARHEVSIVYNGPHLGDEIGVIIESLAGRRIAGANRAK